MPRRHHHGEVWRYHDSERVRIREEASGYWFRADSQGRYAAWMGPYTTEEAAFYAAKWLIRTGFAGEVRDGE